MRRKSQIVVLAFMVAMGGNVGRADERVDFQRQILPIFREHCMKCHGKTKQQGKMSLESAASLQAKWNADPHLLVSAKPEESELYERITLSSTSPKRMPKGSDPLPSADIDLIRRWIEQGAALLAAGEDSSAASSNDGDSTPSGAERQSVEPVLPTVTAARPEAIERLTAAGARVTPLYAESPLLEVSFAGRSEPAGDAEIALLTDVAEQIFTLNLADCNVTDVGLASVSQLKNLASLHLERSNVTDASLAHLSGLSQLQYLNLYGTDVGDAGLKHLAGLKNLRRLYLWQSKASYAAAMALEAEIPGLTVNLGFDHPDVARPRLTKELARAKEQADEANAKVKAAEQQLDWAKKDVDAANARVSEIESELKKLTAPTDGS